MIKEKFDLSVNKLIVLFMLNKISLPMTNSQISNFILAKEYTNYFSLQQYLSEMVDSQLLEIEKIQHNTRYIITENGKKTLSYFQNRIPNTTKQEIIDYLKQNKHKLRTEIEVTSEYILEKTGDYTVHCVAKENETTLIDLKLNAINKKMAISICDNWRNRSQDIYAMIVNELFS